MKKYNKISLLIISALVFFSSRGWAMLSDDFNPNTKEPNPVWRFYDPYGNNTGKSSFTRDGTNALIQVPGGLPHDLWKAPFNQAPRVLQPASNTNFQIEEKVETPLTADTQIQGIIVQQSNGVYLRFDVYYGAITPRVFVAYVNSTTNTTVTYKSALLAKTPYDQYRNFPRYRRVIRSGNQWTFRISYDRQTWTDVVTFNQSLAVTEVGFFAGNTGSNPTFLSSVDYFMDLSAPISDNDNWKAPPPVITTWYGLNGAFGRFGVPGVPQKWANVLGTVFSNIDLSNLTYRLNGGTEQALSFGPDTLISTRVNGRLVKTGDFNIEIPRTSLITGSNSIQVKATDVRGTSSTRTITLDYSPGNTWPLPYTADWQRARNPQTNALDVRYVENIAHVVDGLWSVNASGITVGQRGYDRTIAIGSEAWSGNYEVTVPFTIQSAFSGVGFAVGWQGHEGIRRPRIEWPLMALAWLRGPLSNPSLEIITYGGLDGWEVVRAKQFITIKANTTYFMKCDSVALNSTTSRFFLKIWQQNTSEPSSWNLSADIPTRKGSVLLVANNGVVTFGDVVIRP